MNQQNRQQPTHVLPTSPLHKRYVLQVHLGSGGMGEVYKAKDIQTGKKVAIKKLTETEDAYRQRFAREYRLLKAIDYPHIVKAIDFFEAQKFAKDTRWAIEKC